MNGKVTATNLEKELGLNKKETENFVNDYVEKAIQSKMQEVDKKLQELGMLNNKGEVQSGDAMVGALAKMGAMNYASSKSLTFDGQKIIVVDMFRHNLIMQVLRQGKTLVILMHKKIKGL